MENLTELQQQEPDGLANEKKGEFIVHPTHKTFFEQGSRRTEYKDRMRCSKCGKKGYGLKFACKKADNDQKTMSAVAGSAGAGSNPENTLTKPVSMANTPVNTQDPSEWKPRKRASWNKPRTFCLF